MTDFIGAKVSGFYTSPPETYTDWPAHRSGTQITSPQGNRENYKIWAETLETSTADSIFTYMDGMLAGKTAATRHIIGKGSVVYVGCWLTDWEAVLGKTDKQPLQSYLLNGDNGSTWRITFNPEADFSVEYKESKTS
jgi:hypothetical protein